MYSFHRWPFSTLCSKQSLPFFRRNEYCIFKYGLFDGQGSRIVWCSPAIMIPFPLRLVDRAICLLHITKTSKLGHVLIIIRKSKFISPLPHLTMQPPSGSCNLCKHNSGSATCPQLSQIVGYHKHQPDHERVGTVQINNKSLFIKATSLQYSKSYMSRSTFASLFLSLILL